MTAPAEPRAELRAQIRERRRQVGTIEAQATAAAVATQLLELPEILAARTVAAYLASDGEVDPAAAVEELRGRGVTVLAPVVTGRDMAFAPLGKGTRPGPLGIRQPLGDPVETESIDVVITPLVAVDREGTRLGRGAGYYDRTFAQLLDSRRPGRPFLVGVAHTFQLVAALDRREHDVAVDAVVTPVEVLRYTI